MLATQFGCQLEILGRQLLRGTEAFANHLVLGVLHQGPASREKDPRVVIHDPRQHFEELLPREPCLLGQHVGLHIALPGLELHQVVAELCDGPHSNRTAMGDLRRRGLKDRATTCEDFVLSADHVAELPLGSARPAARHLSIHDMASTFTRQLHQLLDTFWRNRSVHGHDSPRSRTRKYLLRHRERPGVIDDADPHHLGMLADFLGTFANPSPKLGKVFQNIFTKVVDHDVEISAAKIPCHGFPHVPQPDESNSLDHVASPLPLGL